MSLDFNKAFEFSKKHIGITLILLILTFISEIFLDVKGNFTLSLASIFTSVLLMGMYITGTNGIYWSLEKPFIPLYKLNYLIPRGLVSTLSSILLFPLFLGLALICYIVGSLIANVNVSSGVAIFVTLFAPLVLIFVTFVNICLVSYSKKFSFKDFIDLKANYQIFLKELPKYLFLTIVAYIYYLAVIILFACGLGMFKVSVISSIILLAISTSMLIFFWMPFYLFIDLYKQGENSIVN